MNALRGWMLTALMLATVSVQAACTWPAWIQFKKDYISQEGRVIDPSDARKITTSEGQSYALFFALAANDRPAFDLILDWTQNNLAQGSLQAHLPAWLWGQKDPRPGKCWMQTPLPTAISGWPGRCWKPGAYGKRRAIPTLAPRC